MLAKILPAQGTLEITCYNAGKMVVDDATARKAVASSDKGFRRLAGRATAAQKQSAVARWARARPDNRSQRGEQPPALRAIVGPRPRRR